MKLKINLLFWSLLLLFASPVFAGEGAIDSGDTAWIIVSTALVMMMTPAGLALFYGPGCGSSISRFCSWDFSRPVYSCTGRSAARQGAHTCVPLCHGLSTISPP